MLCYKFSCAFVWQPNILTQNPYIKKYINLYNFILIFYIINFCHALSLCLDWVTNSIRNWRHSWYTLCPGVTLCSVLFLTIEVVSSSTRRGSPVARRPSTVEAPPRVKIHPFSKMAVTFEPLIWFWWPLGFRKFLITTT